MKYRLLKGYKYDYAEDESYATQGLPGDIEHPYMSLHNGVLTIKKGYAWDGASFLTIDTKSSMDGSGVHDALYQLMREGLLDRNKWREHADELLRDICIEHSMWKWRADLWFWCVRNWGEKSSMPRKNPRGKIFKV